MSTLEVLFDSEIFVRQQFGGISRYFSELFRQFHNDSSLEIEPLLGFNRNSNLHLEESLQGIPLSLPPQRPSFPGLPRLMNGPDFTKDAFITYRAGRNHHRSMDILHATYMRPRISDRRKTKFSVVTIQDMIAEQLALPHKHPARRGKAQIITASDLIITTSHITADELQRDWPSKAIRVIPLGVDSRFFAHEANEAPIVPFPYVLFVGGRSTYKNFSVLQAAMQTVRSEYDVGLVCVGPNFERHELKDLRFLTDRGLFLHLQAADNQLPNLYRHSSAFVFPSTMEGFGLPVLEAAASGCPVVLSDIPIFREHASDWAEFFDPMSPESLANTLQVVIGSSSRGTAPIRVRDTLFTWTDVARVHAQVYREITGKSL